MQFPTCVNLVVNLLKSESSAACVGVTEVGDTRFLIGASKKARFYLAFMRHNDLVIAKSNPLAESNHGTSTGSSRMSKKKNGFNERLRAERESFKPLDSLEQLFNWIYLEDNFGPITNPDNLYNNVFVPIQGNRTKSQPE
ncbi:hypothetical protein ACFE04_027868 [Oxalis oulophora]